MKAAERRVFVFSLLLCIDHVEFRFIPILMFVEFLRYFPFAWYKLCHLKITLFCVVFCALSAAAECWETSNDLAIIFHFIYKFSVFTSG